MKLDRQKIQKPMFEDNIDLSNHYDMSGKINEMEKLADESGKIDEFEKLKKYVLDTREIISSLKVFNNGYINLKVNEKIVSVKKDIFISELNQILESMTLSRAAYYLKRLIKGITKVKTGKVNDINLYRWKEYNDIITDSLWVIDKRDTSGVHLGWYWGNFIPQIPNQIIRRYTKKGEWVLDPFVGSGTTIIESKTLGRNGVGIELIDEIAEKARLLVKKGKSNEKVIADIVTGESSAIDLNILTREYGIKQFQLVIAHPPYHNIIKFSDNEKDLSLASNTQDFLDKFGSIVDNISPYLEDGRYFALVIGDKYEDGEWIPLGFYCMNEMLKRKYILKSTIVKNFNETKAKRNGKELWRYRALVGGFYVFKHEYIFIFKKSKGRIN